MKNINQRSESCFGARKLCYLEQRKHFLAGQILLADQQNKMKR